MRIAALDLGSNSFHLIVVDVRFDGSFAPLVREKEMLRLGDRVASTGSIGKEGTAQAIEVLARFKAIAEAQRSDELVAVGTAAIREARDGAAFVEQARRDTGIEVRVVDGVEEAQMIFVAVRASVLIEPSPALAVDLGGGSLELMVGDQGGLLLAASARLGVGRLTAELVRSDPPGRSDLRRLEGRISEELRPVLDEVAELKPRMLIGSSGTFACLARMAAGMRDGVLPDSLNQLAVGRDDVEEIADRIMSMTSSERARLPGCDPKRAELLPAGVAVLTYLMDETELDELVISEWALREGIVIQTIGAHERAEFGDDPRAIRRSSVLSLCRRCNWRQPHARQVAAIAGMLFDQTEELHQLGPVERELLEYGALSHDIGEHISRTDHDRHSAYLIENGGLRGFSPEEVRVLSLLGRFHYRGTPRPGTEPFSLLDQAGRERVLALAALLRVADALDATHSGAVRSLRVSRDGGILRLNLITRGDAELEIWALRRKQELFERVFGVDVECEVVRAGRDDLDVDDVYSTGLG